MLYELLITAFLHGHLASYHFHDDPATRDFAYHDKASCEKDRAFLSPAFKPRRGGKVWISCEVFKGPYDDPEDDKDAFK